MGMQYVLFVQSLEAPPVGTKPARSRQSQGDEQEVQGEEEKDTEREVVSDEKPTSPDLQVEEEEEEEKTQEEVRQEEEEVKEEVKEEVDSMITDPQPVEDSYEARRYECTKYMPSTNSV